MEAEKITVGLMKSNVYIVYDPKTMKGIIIDAGGDGKKILNQVYQLGVHVEYLILTHGHIDHISAIENIKEKLDPKVIIHKDDKDFLYDPALNLSSRYARTPLIYSKDIDYILQKDETLNLAGADFEFIHTPGHTPGSICIKTENMLFTGDTLFNGSIGADIPPKGDLQTELVSIKGKLFKLNDDLVCYPGHGAQTTLGYEKSNNPYIY